LSSGTAGSPYAQTLQASGGTPAYTWSITSGSLPSGLTLAATTGTISGTPTASGVTNFTATVTDNGNPALTQSVTTSITVVSSQQTAGSGANWYIRPDGGTRYSSNVTTGQCDGQADVPYPGSGTNQHCAFNDFRYLWDDNSGAVGQGTWVIAGGDTVLVRGCTALPGQQNPSNPGCRIGWDKNIGSGPDSSWCYGVGSYSCFNPPIPSGTALHHTRILGQNYAACNAGGATNPKLYQSNLTQIFGGFSTFYTLNLQNTSYVDVQCLEITSHNGACTHIGIPSYPRDCNSSQPLDDYATSGILTNNATSNITFQDVYIHGFNSSGLSGPIGGPITMTRMFVGFNAFAGWNFDDGHSTPDAPGSSITASYVTMNWNGCYEEYPIVDPIPARVCYDTQSGGFGDSWSGQQTTLDSFSCDHCVDDYNTKDAFIGPHTFTTTLSITNSEAIGNEGQSWKWGGSPVPTTVTFLNNLTVGNCNRLSQPFPGAPSNYNQYLAGFCRAAGNVLASDIPTGSNWLIANNTWVTYQPTVFDIACPGYSPCTSTVDITNNIFLGYNDPSNPYGALTPAVYYIEDPSISIVSSHNDEYGMRNGACQSGGTGILCLDPRFVNEPSQTWVSEATLDNFNFSLSNTSPAIGAGTTYSVLPSTDYFGKTTSNPPVIGAVTP
jgi:Putative Ig domain